MNTLAAMDQRLTALLNSRTTRPSRPPPPVDPGFLPGNFTEMVAWLSSLENKETHFPPGILNQTIQVRRMNRSLGLPRHAWAFELHTHDRRKDAQYTSRGYVVGADLPDGSYHMNLCTRTEVTVRASAAFNDTFELGIMHREVRSAGQLQEWFRNFEPVEMSTRRGATVFRMPRRMKMIDRLAHSFCAAWKEHEHHTLSAPAQSNRKWRSVNQWNLEFVEGRSGSSTKGALLVNRIGHAARSFTVVTVTESAGRLTQREKTFTSEASALQYIDHPTNEGVIVDFESPILTQPVTSAAVHHQGETGQEFDAWVKSMPDDMRLASLTGGSTYIIRRKTTADRAWTLHLEINTPKVENCIALIRQTSIESLAMLTIFEKSHQCMLFGPVNLTRAMQTRLRSIDPREDTPNDNAELVFTMPVGMEFTPVKRFVDWIGKHNARPAFFDEEFQEHTGIKLHKSHRNWEFIIRDAGIYGAIVFNVLSDAVVFSASIDGTTTTYRERRIAAATAHDILAYIGDYRRWEEIDEGVLSLWAVC